MRNEALLPLINYIITHISLYFTPSPKKNMPHKFANFQEINEGNRKTKSLKTGRNVLRFPALTALCAIWQAPQDVQFFSYSCVRQRERMARCGVSMWETHGETDRPGEIQNKWNNAVHKIKSCTTINNLSKIWEVSECQNLAKHLQLLNFTTNQQTSANYDFEGIKSHSGSWSQIYLRFFSLPLSQWTA